MHVKTFRLNQEEEANSFLETVVTGENGIQVVDDTIVVFYEATKEEYETKFLDRMAEGLKRNLFHEAVRQAVTDAEYEVAKEKGTSYPNFDELSKKKDEIGENIKTFEAKIAALESWTANKS